MSGEWQPEPLHDEQRIPQMPSPSDGGRSDGNKGPVIVDIGGLDDEVEGDKKGGVQIINIDGGYDVTRMRILAIQ